KVSPIGCSDSHDVNRYLLGQGRTYIRCDDRDPSRIDVEAACESLRRGRVLISMGLLVELTVNDRFGPGDLVRSSGTVKATCRVQGPSWTDADHVALYANGEKIRETRIA
ncbi:MAG: hypothetical protein N2C14_24790, partial [Planctomycetales bacterium]